MHKFLLIGSEEFTLADRRFYNCLLAKAIPELPKKFDFSINLNDLENVYGYGIPEIDEVKISIKKLINTHIECINSAKENCWLITPLFNYIQYDKSGALEYSFSSKAAQLLIIPEYFEKHIIQAHFIYKYSISLYDILSKAYFKKCLNLLISVDQLRNALGINSSKFTNFNDLKRYVLEPSFKEINAHASFSVNFKTKSSGRKITEIDFIFTKKAYKYQHFHAKQLISDELQAFFIKNPNLVKAYKYLVNTKTEERGRLFNLARKSELVKNNYLKDEDVDNPGLWFKFIKDKLL